jgi:hypothetical protein
MQKGFDRKLTDQKVTRVDPYKVSEQGWRGLGLPAGHKRKWYTVLQNERVLVTALITLPGETSVRHAHESGELSLNFLDRMNPRVTWHPPGEFHGGGELVNGGSNSETLIDQITETRGKAVKPAIPEIESIFARLDDMESQFKQLQTWIQGQLKPDPSPRLLIDIIFPPFKTIIDDPRFPPKKIVTGQWFD